MTRKNYEDMKSGKVAEVVIPLSEGGSKNDAFTIPVVAVAFHFAPVFGCILKTPTTVRSIEAQKILPHISKIVYSLMGSLQEKSGLYTYTCSGNQPNFVSNRSQRITASVSLYLRFIIGKVE